jgi:hypothetical protein
MKSISRAHGVFVAAFLLLLLFSAVVHVNAQTVSLELQTEWQLPSGLSVAQERLTATDAALTALAMEDQGYWIMLFTEEILKPSERAGQPTVALIINYRWMLGVNTIIPGFFYLGALSFPDPDDPKYNLEMYAYGAEFGNALRVMRKVASGGLTDAEGFKMLTAILMQLKPL